MGNDNRDGNVGVPGTGRGVVAGMPVCLSLCCDLKCLGGVPRPKYAGMRLGDRTDSRATQEAARIGCTVGPMMHSGMARMRDWAGSTAREVQEGRG